jgi:hypothetical protein
MFLIRWRKRLLACALLCLMSLLLLVSTQHRLRLAVIKLTPVSSPSVLNSAPEQLKDFRFYPIHAHDTSSFDQAMRLFREYTLAYPPVEAYALPMSEDPDSCVDAVRARKPVHCYNVDIAYAQMFGANGFYTRMWDFNGCDGLGGFGHNIIEIWDEAARKWKAVDPYYHCYYMRGDSAIGVLELRHRLLTNDTSLHVMSYYERDSIYDSAAHAYVHPIYRAPNELLSELRFLAPAAMLHANNNFKERYAHRYGPLQFMAPQLDKLPLRYARGVRAAMMGSDDARYMIEDGYTPKYAAAAVYVSARVLLYLAILFALLSMIGFVRSRRAPVVVVAPPVRPQVPA